MAPSGFMMDARRLTKTALDVHGRLQLRLHQADNDTWMGYIEDPRMAEKDDIGALYYVIAVIFIYGLSIVMMIASHIRKNKQDCQLRAYLKEMAVLRKADRRDKLMGRISSLATAAKTKNVFKGEGQGCGKGLFKLTSKGSFTLGSTQDSDKPGSVGCGEKGSGKKVKRREGVEMQTLPLGDTKHFVGMRSAPDLSRPDDGNETADSEFLEIPVDIDLKRLSPSHNVTPLTSASATPSPPPRRELKEATTKICFEDEGFVL